MRVEDAAARAAEVRALVPAGASVASEVAAIIADVRERGDAAVAEYEARFASSLRRSTVDDEVRAGLEVAIANVRAVALAGVDEDRHVRLPEGQTVTLREIPVRRAAVYAPGRPAPVSVVGDHGRGHGPGGRASTRSTWPARRIRCCWRRRELCEVDGVFNITGAHGIAALAYGTETVPRVDVIVGPGLAVGAGGQAAGVARRRDRRLRRAVRPDGDRVRGRRRRGAARWISPRRPSTARGR